jgi:hypothetical protein
MVEIESNDLVDGREFQGGELAKDHLGRETLIVIVDEVIESDPVPDQTHFIIGMPVQAGGAAAGSACRGETSGGVSHGWPVACVAGFAGRARAFGGENGKCLMSADRNHNAWTPSRSSLRIARTPCGVTGERHTACACYLRKAAHREAIPGPLPI